GRHPVFVENGVHARVRQGRSAFRSSAVYTPSPDQGDCRVHTAFQTYRFLHLWMENRPETARIVPLQVAHTTYDFVQSKACFADTFSLLRLRKRAGYCMVLPD